MKYISTFESFITDDNRHDTEYLPSYNPEIELKAKEFVDTVFNSQYLNLAKLTGVSLQTDGSPTEEETDEIKSKAIEYYKKNPEAIGKDVTVSAIPPKVGDGIPRVQKIGGTSFANSRRVGE